MSRAETPYLTLWMEDGILYAVYADKVEVDLTVAKAVVEARINFSEKKSYPCIIDMRGIKSINKEARNYLANEGAQYIIACGLIVGNPFTRTIAHLFLTINKPKVPILLFGDTASAKKWLIQFVGPKPG